MSFFVLLLMEINQKQTRQRSDRRQPDSYTMGKYCLTNSSAFNDSVTAETAREDLCLDFSKAFVMVHYNILFSRQERYRFDGLTVQWTRNWL